METMAVQSACNQSVHSACNHLPSVEEEHHQH